MKIGILNELLNKISYHITYEDSTLIPRTEEDQNPLEGGTLLLKWSEIRDTGIEIHMDFDQECFVDRAVVSFGEKTKLTSAVLKSGSDVLFTYTAETGKTIVQNPMELEAGILTGTLTLVLTGYFSDMEICSVQLYGALMEGADLFPTPVQASVGEELVPIANFTGYASDCAAGMQAGKVLAERFQEITGYGLHPSERGNISFVMDDTVSADGYEMEISEEKTRICASNLRGFVCGAESFLKLTTASGVRACRISDNPQMKFRGVHLYLPSVEHMDFTKRLVKYLISPMGYNAIIMEVGAGMRFDSHPEINAATEDAIAKGRQGVWPSFPHESVADGTTVEKQTVRDLVAYIRSFGIEVIPEVQSLGHVPYLTHTHPEIAEIEEEQEKLDIDTRAEDARPSDFYPHCYCPSNERSYEILFDLLDEIIEVFEPREYVHMGHDEVYKIGVCPVCKEKSPAELFAQDVNRIYDHLKEKGLKMMIWADMVQPVTKYLTPEAIDLIPKDIVLLDFIWYFHMKKDIEDNLLSKGFQVILGNLYSSHYPRYEKRSKKEGVIGGQISAWTLTSEKGLQQEGKLYDFLYTAQMLWSGSYSHEYRLVYDRMISAMMPRLRENLKGVKYPSLMPGASFKVLAENPVSFPPVLPIQQKTVFEVEEKFDSLVIYHTELRKLTRMPWAKHDVVGHYLLQYTDGSEEKLPITNSGNIGYWNRRHNQPLTFRLYRHTGYCCVYETDGEEFKTADGRDVTIYRYEYILPKDKVLKTVSLEENPEFDAKILLYRAEGVRGKEI